MLPKGHYRLTPRYDVLSAHPLTGHGTGKIAPQELKMAMKAWGKNSHYQWERIQRRHWRITATDCGLGAQLDDLLEELLESTPPALERAQSTLPTDFPAAISESI